MNWLFQITKINQLTAIIIIISNIFNNIIIYFNSFTITIHNIKLL